MLGRWGVEHVGEIHNAKCASGEQVEGARGNVRWRRVVSHAHYLSAGGRGLLRGISNIWTLDVCQLRYCNTRTDEIEQSRRHCNTIRSACILGNRPPAVEAIQRPALLDCPVVATAGSVARNLVENTQIDFDIENGVSSE